MFIRYLFVSEKQVNTQHQQNDEVFFELIRPTPPSEWAAKSDASFVQWQSQTIV